MFALDLLNQFQSYNGTLLAAGKIYVYHLGRTHLAPVYGDHNGATVLPNPVILDDQGMAEIYLNDAFNYTVVVCDAYGAEQFSRDVYPKGMGNGESIGTQLYEGIDPIVVNNDVYAISANTSRLGVVTPLYFVKDDEEETIIGFSGKVIPEGVMTESALGYENNKITGYNGSAFSAGNEYEAGENIDITNSVISGKNWSNEINEASANAYSQSTAWTDSQGYLTGVDLSEYAKTDFIVSSIDAATSGKYDTSSFSAISGSFLTAHQSLPQSADWNGATTVVNNNSAIWNNTTNVVSSNSASWGATNPQIPVTGINGIKISESGDKVVFEVSGDYATNDDLTSKQDSLTYGYHDTVISSIDSSALYDNSAHARINTLAGRISDLSSNKLDESAFSDVSGDMATTGDINDLVTSIAETYQPKLSFEYNEDSAISAINGSALAGGSYQPSGNYIPYTAANDETFITNSALNIQKTAGGGGLDSNYMGYNSMQIRYMQGALNYGAILTNSQLKFETNSDSAYVDREKIHKWDSASDYIQNNSAALNEVSAKLDTTAFSTVSGDFYTTANESGFITGVGDTYLQNTDLGIVDNKVTAISGIVLSAGTELNFGYIEI